MGYKFRNCEASVVQLLRNAISGPPMGEEETKEEATGCESVPPAACSAELVGRRSALRVRRLRELARRRLTFAALARQARRASGSRRAQRFVYVPRGS